MAEIGVKELKTRASQIVREVREQQATYVVTHRGKPVGLLTPYEELSEISSPVANYGTSDAWQRLQKLGEQVSKRWTSEKTAVDLVSEMRR